MPTNPGVPTNPEVPTNPGVPTNPSSECPSHDTDDREDRSVGVGGGAEGRGLSVTVSSWMISTGASSRPGRVPRRKGAAGEGDGVRTSNIPWLLGRRTTTKPSSRAGVSGDAPGVSGDASPRARASLNGVRALDDAVGVSARRSAYFVRVTARSPAPAESG